MSGKSYIYKTFKIRAGNWEILAEKLNVLGSQGWLVINSEEVGYNANTFEEKIDPINGITFELFYKSQSEKTSDIGMQALVTYTNVLCVKEVSIQNIGIDLNPEITAIKSQVDQGAIPESEPVPLITEIYPGASMTNEPKLPDAQLSPSYKDDVKIISTPDHYVEGYSNPAVILSDIANFEVPQDGYKFNSKFDLTFIVPHNGNERRSSLLETLRLWLTIPVDLSKYNNVFCTFQIFIVCDNLGVQYSASLSNEITNLLQRELLNPNKKLTNLNCSEFIIHVVNQVDGKGGFGHACRNWVKNHPQLINGDYVAFIDDDDLVTPEHAHNIHTEIQKLNKAGKSADLFRFDTLVRNHEGVVITRKAEGTRGKVGHSEMVISKDRFIQLKDQNDTYGHDWDWHQEIVNTPMSVVRDADNANKTYTVISRK